MSNISVPSLGEDWLSPHTVKETLNVAIRASLSVFLLKKIWLLVLTLTTHQIFFSFSQADDSGDLQESPYIGRARYRANQFALESSGGASPSPQRASVLHSSRRSSSLHSPGGGGILRRSLSPPSKVQAQAELDAQLEQKHAEVQKSELYISN